jgi:hypothetical protein
MRKGIISYFRTNEINNLEKHVDANHDMFAKKFDEELNSYIKANVVKQCVFLKTNIYGTSIFNLFSSIVFSKEDELEQKIVFERFGIVNYEKPSSNAICLDHMAKIILNAFISKIFVSIQKTNSHKKPC